MEQAAYFPGLPRRMGVALSAMFARGDYHGKRSVIADVQSDTESVPLTAGDEAFFAAADQAIRTVYRYAEKLKTFDLITDGIALLCHSMRVSYPAGDTPREQIARAVDRAWWVRQIRKEHARRFEHVAIQLGFTSTKTGPYLSHESAARQARRNAQNAKLLASIELQNEHGQTYTLEALAALGTANKSIRRGELMTRIRGFEEIAFDLGHVGLFATVTCPSKFHSVGGMNPNYNGATPRQAQAYLVDVWALMRSALHRAGIRTYGFRIAEPHTDGCPHWHLLLFVEAEKLDRMRAIIETYALAEDGAEKGAKKNRVKLVNIEAGKGTAAGYIAKYVAKNIDGEAVGDHKTRDGWIIAPDMFDGQTFTPSQRVTYWSQLHGIRQFQQIGGAPVGVWRELRRIKADAVANAAPEIKAAWQAVQKIENADDSAAKQADFAAYVQAQGGAFIGRRAAIRIAKRETLVEGRYSTRNEQKPCGVYLAARPEAVYESVRYTWTVKERAVAVAVALPWTGVNNCTEPGKNAAWIRPENKKNSTFVHGGERDFSETVNRQPESDLKTYQAHRKEKQNWHLAELQWKYQGE